jgi:hypothetical protein
LLTAAARGGLLASLAGATFRVAVHAQDLLNNIVNLSEHENANFFLPLGRREQNESRDHGANVDDNAAKFVRRARLEFYGFWQCGCPFER